MDINNLVQNHHLYCDNYPSDKVYLVSKIKRPLVDLWDVEFAYGRRRQHLTQGSKGKALSKHKADALVSKLIDSKLKKGYRYEDKGYSITDPTTVYLEHCEKLLLEKIITKEQYEKINIMLESSDEEIQGLGQTLIQTKEDTWEQN